MGELHDLTAIEQRDALREGRLEPPELVRHYLERIARQGDRFGAFVEVTGAIALQRSRDLQAGRIRDLRPDGGIWGMPFGDKDLVARAGIPTRYGSGTRRDFVPSWTDAPAAVMDEAGGISLGKTNTPEFGLTGYTESRVAPPARDPWDPSRGAGGSSGGAAAAVAAGLLPFAPASDGGGSIRIPAATVGIVGIKPSRGRVAVGSGLDSPGGLAVTGPLARTVADAALLLDVLAGGRPLRYATVAPGSGPFLTAAQRPQAHGTARIGVTVVSPWDDAEDIRLDADAARAVSVAAQLLTDAAHGVEELRWEPRGYAELFHVLWRSSAARLPLSDSDLGDVEPITAWLVREGRALSGVDLLNALAAATSFERATIEAFAPFDAVLTPALALPPQPIGSYDATDAVRNFSQQVQYAPYSSFVNVAGLPALVVPVTTTAAGHPVSVQLVGRPGGEAAIIALAAELERRAGDLGRPPCW